MNSVASGLALIFTLASGVAAYAQDTGDAAAGAAFARTACGSCHATQARQEVSPQCGCAAVSGDCGDAEHDGNGSDRVAPHVASDNAQPAAYTD
jgi:hypothetical protein